MPTRSGARASGGAEGSAVSRQRVTAAFGSARTGSSCRRDRRSTMAVTPEASAASCSRREAVSVSPPSSSPTTPARPPPVGLRYRSPSSITDRTCLSASARISRSGCSPTPASAGANRSSRVSTHSTGPRRRPSAPATNSAAAAACSVSGPVPATSCNAPMARPPSGKCRSRAAMPKPRAGADRRPGSRAMRAIRQRRSVSTWGWMVAIGVCKENLG